MGYVQSGLLVVLVFHELESQVQNGVCKSPLPILQSKGSHGLSETSGQLISRTDILFAGAICLLESTHASAHAGLGKVTGL